eukprot:scaffold5597_cov154-Skeletonema_dohrnii-CCMP3373.AAC.3
MYDVSSVDDFKLNHKATNTSMYTATSDTLNGKTIASYCCRSPLHPHSKIGMLSQQLKIPLLQRRKHVFWSNLPPIKFFDYLRL